MARVRVSTIIDAPPPVVWNEVRTIERHVDWMADAARITFEGSRRTGVGTRFVCLTRVGPIRLKDRMEITEWREGKVIGVRHTGLVSGRGRFLVVRARGGRSRFIWDERLKFPWWLGGPVGSVVGALVMRRIWKHNLRTLKGLVESGNR